MKLRFLMSHCKKFSEGHSGRLTVSFVQIQREAHPTECGPLQRVGTVAMKCGLVSFCELGDFIC